MLIFADVSFFIAICVAGYLLLARQPRVCEKCERRATRLTSDGLDMCEACANEHMAKLKENS